MLSLKILIIILLNIYSEIKVIKLKENIILFGATT